ncbi:MAG TPA: TRAP transporter substrate-binding protein DctP, partial [Spirochaetia bacterium]|nr:TRAP transporter substrate-binding protein DctP [Spirochaetia bacterium]
MSPLKKAAFCLVFLSWLIWPLSAQIIKMGTLVPGGSPWDQNLRILAADWDRITNGKVQLKIYAGGRAGDESDMLRKMRFNQLQAVGLSIGGLSQVYGGVLAPAIPMLVETEDELMYLLEKLMSVFLVEFEKKGFKILFWNLAGWAHFFSREPIVYPADLKKQKMWIMEGNTDESNTWKKLGFQAVTFTTMDMLIQ